MLERLLELFHARRIDVARLLADLRHVGFGDDAELRPRLARQHLDAEPVPVLGALLPDRAHLGQRVPGYHDVPPVVARVYASATTVNAASSSSQPPVTVSLPSSVL